MFYYARAFNQPINYIATTGSWNTSNVTDMSYMFAAAVTFNNNGSANIGSWNTSNVTNMNSMFQGASAFNQNIRAWVVTKVTPKPPSSFSAGSALTPAYNPGWTYPTFGTFTLPSDVSVYKNVTITRQLTPPTSNSSGAFSYTSSNSAVATITNNAGVYSINVIGIGSTTITATQAASGDYTALQVTASLVVTLLYPVSYTHLTLPTKRIV